MRRTELEKFLGAGKFWIPVWIFSAVVLVLLDYLYFGPVP